MLSNYCSNISGIGGGVCVGGGGGRGIFCQDGFDAL